MVDDVMLKATSVAKVLISALPCPDQKNNKTDLTDENIKAGGFQEQGRGVANMRDVLGYEGLYKITEAGQVWSIKKQKWLSVFPRDRRGWLAVQLYKNGQQKLCRPHKLVGQAYIPNPENKPQVNHIDCNKSNNNYKNLEWVTHQENTNHAKANGLMWFQKENHAS